MGAELKDPQTGESLGRSESRCCDVIIDNVTPKLSYGHLENVKIALDGISPGGLQVREAIQQSAIAPETGVATIHKETIPVTASSGGLVKKKTPTKQSTTGSDDTSQDETKPSKW